MDAVATSSSPTNAEIEQLQVRLAELTQTAARRARELTALHEIALEIGQLTDLTTLLRVIVEKAAGLLNARMGGLYLVQADTQTLELVVAHNLPGIKTGTILNLGEGLSGRIAQTGQVLTVTDYQAWPGRAAVYAQSPFRRVVGVPLKIGEKVIGVINITDDAQAGDFAEDEIRLVVLFAEQAALAIDKARLLAEVQRDLAERQRAEQIQSSLHRLTAAVHTTHNLDELYRSIHAIIAELMPARNFGIALYDAATDSFTFPYRVDEYHPGELMPPPRRAGQTLVDYVWETGAPLLATKEQLEHLTIDQQLHPVGVMALDWLGVPLKGPEGPIGVLVVQTYTAGERLTEEHQQLLLFVSTQIAMAIQRKRTEEALRESEEKYRILFSNELVAISLFEAQGLQLLDVNPAFERMYGYSRAELLGGMTVRDISAEPAQSRASVQQALTGGTMFVPLRYHRKKDGTVFPVELVSGPFRWKDRTVFFAWIQDITERRQAETALRDSEQRYHDLFEEAQRQARELTLLDRVRTAVTRELNLTELFRTVVTAIAETLGYTLVSLYVVEGQLLRLQHQVGYDLILDEIPITSGVTGRVARTGRPELIEDVFAEPTFLASMDDIISEIAVPLVDAGRTVGVLNIESTRGYRLTEADLRLMMALGEHVNGAISRARLYTEARQNAARLTAAVESLPFDFWSIGLDGRYVLQNSASTRHWGERVGKRVDELDLPQSLRDHWRANDQRAFAGEVVQGEITYQIAGEQHSLHEIIAPIWSEGEIQGIIGVNIDITDRQRAEAALRASEARLRAVTANIPVILFALDGAGQFTFVEGRGLDSLNVAAAQLVGQSVFEVARSMPRVLTAMKLALDGEPLNTIFELNQRAYEVWLSPLASAHGDLDGVIGVAVDMTERERTAQALRDSEERYRILFDSNPHPMWAYDLETLDFLTVNDAALSHYGYSREEFLSMTIADIRPVNDMAALRENVAQVTGGLDRAGVWRHRKKDGTLIEVEITSHTLELDGRPAEVVLATDVTERRRTEEALHRAQKMESLGLLAGGIAHDFNNLLVAMLGQTSLALSQLNTNDPARAPIEKAVAAARRAADLTRQLLAYSGRGQFERRPIDLNRLIQENLHLFEVAVPKHVALRSDLVSPLPVIVGDAGQLQQVIMNMIINAAEAIGDKPGEVIVRTRVRALTSEAAAAWQIGDEALPAGDYVLLLVEDNGQGMDAATLSRIFDPFFSTKFTGRGLGLAAVLGIVRGHGGGLKVTSTPQLGTLFEIIFPGGTAEVLAPVISPAPQEVNMAQQLVLVIDDEAPVRDAVTDILELEGVSVLTAPDGQAGIALYRQWQTGIGLIMLDLSMPGLNGEETLRELRLVNPQVRVLLSSGYSRDEVAPRFAGQGAVGFIQKPYDAAQLVREVKRYLTQPLSA